MVDTAVIQDKDTVFPGIRIHHSQQTFKPQQELISIIASGFDMAVNDALSCESR
jgi:hypothetical protein